MATLTDTTKLQLPARCNLADNCVDYQSFKFNVTTDLTHHTYTQIYSALKDLGKAKPERLGVTYVYANWGFFVIPPLGFPELKVNFFHQIHNKEINHVLHLIHTLLMKKQCLITNRA